MDANAATPYERLRESAARAVAALLPYRHEYENVRWAIRDIVWHTRKARRGNA